MRAIIIQAALAGILCATVPAAAQNQERYTLEKTEDGYVRMDNVTGRMSLCRERSGQLVCALAADDREAFDQELERLQDKIAAIEERLTALEGRTAQESGELPSEDEFEKTMGYMERFFRRFMDIVKEFDSGNGNAETEPETPEKT